MSLFSCGLSTGDVTNPLVSDEANAATLARVCADGENDAFNEVYGC